MAYVLVVDDDQAIRFALRDVLEGEGFEVTEAANGLEAIHALRASLKARVVLLDFMMPQFSGLDVLRVLDAERELRDRHAFILLTANRVLPPEMQSFLEDLDIPIIRKPFDLEDVVGAVNHALDQIEHSADSATPAGNTVT